MNSRNPGLAVTSLAMIDLDLDFDLEEGDGHMKSVE
jgi:hypothetical protein